MPEGIIDADADEVVVVAEAEVEPVPVDRTFHNLTLQSKLELSIKSPRSTCPRPG